VGKNEAPGEGGARDAVSACPIVPQIVPKRDDFIPPKTKQVEQGRFERNGLSANLSSSKPRKEKWGLCPGCLCREWLYVSRVKSLWRC